MAIRLIDAFGVKVEAATAEDRKLNEMSQRGGCRRATPACSGYLAAPKGALKLEAVGLSGVTCMKLFLWLS